MSGRARQLGLVGLAFTSCVLPSVELVDSLDGTGGTGGAQAAASGATNTAGKNGNNAGEGAGGMSNDAGNGSGGNTVGGNTVGGNTVGGNTVGGNTADAGEAGTSVGEGGGGGAGPEPEDGSTNYQVNGSWPERPIAFKPKPGKLTYQQITVETDFLAESCAIGDYDRDGIPDISSGRHWYEGPAFTTKHVFRDGHGALPRAGASAELETGASDDYADYAYDVNDDGWTDIINISNPDAAESANPSPAPAPQKKASAYWYENPGPSVKTSTSWKPYLIHDDVRGEQHGIADVDGDGKPEIYGACKDCSPQQTKGYYYADWDNPEAKWSYHAVTGSITFPFGGTGWMHGFGINDVNGDGEPDFLERDGIWIDARATSPNTLVCPAAGCGFVKTPLYGGGAGTELGGAHMYAFDVDGDGDSDIVSADFAHNYGISWYEQGPPLTFTKRTFVGAPNEIALYGVSFSQAHALQVADMDGDGVPDLITGKMRYAHPIGYGDPDIEGNPVLYVFKTLRNTPSIANGGSVTFEPHLVDGAPSKVGVGRQLAVGHANTDGILDICVATKLGLYVFLGQ